MSVLEVSHVSKSFGSKHVLSDINLSFDGNKIYGLLGRNGAGKAHCSVLLPTGFLPTAAKLRLILRMSAITTQSWV